MYTITITTRPAINFSTHNFLFSLVAYYLGCVIKTANECTKLVLRVSEFFLVSCTHSVHSQSQFALIHLCKCHYRTKNLFNQTNDCFLPKSRFKQFPKVDKLYKTIILVLDQV